MKICIVGTGYVGLVTGACFAEMGNRVTCVDRDTAKIAELTSGKIRIFEPGLESLCSRNQNEGRLAFTPSLERAVAEAEVVFLAVGTPSQADGSVNLDHVMDAAAGIGQHISRYAIVVNKSTVPVGTAEKVTATISRELERRQANVEFDVVSNPEFLKEGAAVNDFMRPDRIIIGTQSTRATAILQQLYGPFMRSHDRLLVVGVRDAEMIKYAANTMLATKISFMNEIAHLCEHYGIDVELVRRGIGSDSRIGYSFIYPGCGYGGSCLPKDVRALAQMGRAAGVPMEIVETVDRRNTLQKRRLFEKITAKFGASLAGHSFVLWGLSFKPDTDDVREAPSLALCDALIGASATVTAYDPVASGTFRDACKEEWLRKGQISLARDQYEALAGASALVLVTEWRQFRNPDFEKIKRALKTPIIFDGRNQYNPQDLRHLGFEYFGIGR